MAWVEYYNLMQGIPAYPLQEKLCYFRSSDVEHKHWHRLLWSVSDEMLFLLAKGVKIKIYDRSLKTRGKIEKIFCPVLTELLNKIWLDIEPAHQKRQFATRISPKDFEQLKKFNFENHYEFASNALFRDKLLEERFMFWRPYAQQTITKKTDPTTFRESWVEVKGITQKIKEEMENAPRPL